MRLVYRVAAVGHKCPTAVPWIVSRIFQPHTHIFQTVFVQTWLQFVFISRNEVYSKNKFVNGNMFFLSLKTSEEE